MTSSAPAPSAALITADLRVSIDTAVAARGQLLDHRQHPLDLVAFPHRRCAGTRGFAADIDDRGALGRHIGAGLGGRCRIGVGAAIGKAVGRRVDDAHHLRLVESDRSLAQLQRDRGRGDPRPIGGHRLVETASIPSTGTSSLTTRRLALDADQLDQAEPVQPAGEPRDLAVMAEGGIDEARGPDKRAHVPLIALPDAACRNASIGCSLPSCSTCQKVQPLHDGAPCKRRANLVDRPGLPFAGDRAVRADAGRPATLGVRQTRVLPGPSRFRPAGQRRRAAGCACRPSPSSRFRRAAGWRRSVRCATFT